MLDDFGTGHSSLNHLREFRLDGLKLSAGFVHGLEHDRKTAAIVAAVALLARGLAIAVTAEGLETDGQLACVQAHGIELVQGFLFSRPLDTAGIGALLWRGALDGQDTKPLHGLGTEATAAAPQAQALRQAEHRAALGAAGPPTMT